MIRDNQRNLERLFLVTWAFIPLVFIPLGETFDHFYLPKVIAMLGVVSLFVILILVKKIKLPMDAVTYALMAYGLWVFIGFLLAESRSLAFFGRPYRHEGFLTLTLYAFLFLLGRLQIDLSSKWMNLIFVSATLIGVYAWMQTQGIYPFERDFVRAGWTSAFATFGNPNFLSTYFVVMVFAAFSFYLASGNKWYIVVALFFLFVVFLSKTLSAYFGLGGGYIVLLMASYQRNQTYRDRVRWIVLTSILTMTGSYVFVPSVQQQTQLLMQEISEFFAAPFVVESGGSYRIFIWNRTWQLIQRYPVFGVGLEHLGIFFSRFFLQDTIEVMGSAILVDKAHNEYLHIAVSSGVMALVLYVYFIFKSIQYRFKHQVSIHDIGILSVLVAYMSQAFFNISVVSVAYIFWLLLGYFARVKTDCDEPTEF